MLGCRLLLVRQRCSTLIERWDGTSWSIVSSPNTSANAEQLPPRRDVHVGVGVLGRRLLLQRQRHFSDLDRALDGTSWAIVSSPNTSTTDYNSLSGVTCVSASECWAVGYYFTGDNFVDQTLIERWDGTSWSIVSSPNTSTTEANVPLRPDVRVSVGVLGRRLLLRTRRPHFSDPDRALGRDLVDNCQFAQHQHAVQCPLRGNVRVGVRLLGRWRLRFTGSVLQTLIERWDGTSWEIVKLANTSTTQSNLLYSVTCGPASDCWAVGYYIVDAVSKPQSDPDPALDGTSWESSARPTPALRSPTCSMA